MLSQLCSCPIIIVSKYLGDEEVFAASKASKIQFVKNLISLLHNPGKYALSLNAIEPGMVKSLRGAQTQVDKLVVVDVDPSIVSWQAIIGSRHGKSAWCAEYIKKCCSVFVE